MTINYDHSLAPFLVSIQPPSAIIRTGKDTLARSARRRARHTGPISSRQRSRPMGLVCVMQFLLAVVGVAGWRAFSRLLSIYISLTTVSPSSLEWQLGRLAIRQQPQLSFLSTPTRLDTEEPSSVSSTAALQLRDRLERLRHALHGGIRRLLSYLWLATLTYGLTRSYSVALLPI